VINKENVSNQIMGVIFLLLIICAVKDKINKIMTVKIEIF